MKNEALQVSGSVIPAPTQPDFTTRLLNHPEIQALNPKGALSPREKAIALAASLYAQEEMYNRRQNSGPDRIVKALFLQRWLSAVFGRSQDSKPKSLSERLATVLPIVALLTIAVASLITGATAGWKDTSSAGKELVATLKEQLRNAQDDLKAERDKNDGLQNEINTALRDAAKQKTDTDTLMKKIWQLQQKYKSLTTQKQSGPSTSGQ